MIASNLMSLGRFQPGAKYAQLDRNPGYWRGRAQTLRDFAAKERQAGNDRLADELDVRATEYEDRADELAVAFGKAIVAYRQKEAVTAGCEIAVVAGTAT